MKKLRRRRQRLEWLSVGSDLHPQYIEVSVLDEAGDERRGERLAAQPGATQHRAARCVSNDVGARTQHPFGDAMWHPPRAQHRSNVDSAGAR
jgi:hypothetical protein